MTTPPDRDELAERGRAIFDSLRAEETGAGAPANAGGDAPPTPDAEAPTTEQVDVSEAIEDSSVPPEPTDPEAPLPVLEDVLPEEGSEALATAGGEDPSEILPPRRESALPVTPSAPPARPGPIARALPTDLPDAAAPAAPVDVPEDVAADDEAPPVLSEPPAELAADRFARPLPRVLAIANQKGGVGKTTTAVNLGAALAELGYRVLVIDLDPQGNATTGLGVNPRNLEHSVYDVLTSETPLEDCIEPTTVRNLFVVPATIDLAGAEIELVPAFSRELRLRRAIDALGGEFEFTLIDCPPSLGLITVNGLAAATEVVVPIQCEYYALEGLGQLLRNVNLVQANLNPRLEVSAIILTMYDARTKLADQVASEVRAHFGDKVCRNIVPRTVRLSEAPSFGQPITVFDPSSRGAIAYRELAKEVSGGAPQRIG